MNRLAYQRCFNHGEREAVARCPECTRFFCRECITEHEDRVLCAACLKLRARPALTKRPAFLRILQAAQCVIGLMIVWFFFFLIGSALVAQPDEFHENAVWKVPWFEEQ